MGKKPKISDTNEFFLQNNHSKSFNLNDPNIYAQLWVQIWTQRNMLQQQKIQRELEKRQYRQNSLNENYPVRCVIAHSVIILMICVTILALQIEMENLFNAFAGIIVSFYLMVNILIALIVSKCITDNIKF